MLPKEYRLKKKSAFTATYKSGKSFHRNGITMFCGKKKQDMLPCKAGFVVSKKIHKRAVKRNRIKRLMRESYRLIIKSQNEPKEYMSIIFVASAKLLGKSFSEIDNSVKELVQLL